MTKQTTQRRPLVIAAFIATFALLFGGAVGATAAAMITGADIKNGTVLSQDIKNGSIGLHDIGPWTAQSLQGSDGADGADGVSGYEVVGVEEGPFDPGMHTVVAECPADKVAVGGGTKVDGAGDKATALTDGPTGFTEDADGVWSVNAWTGTFDVTARTNVTTYVLCALA